ncbi:hypothetical protein [Eggerthella sp. YY7918]|uniref:hypothetical protein n=1 Tax=Eggerthella sp. (strain YY7918) TaxID=502558 RepID=UPI0005A1B180|nr:hypothetical protein [Eggerthella sp. YY7918]
MSNQSREKTALVVFAGLIVLSLTGLVWYLIAGHSWNVAASNIDDTFGSMDGYTAILYEGVEKPKKSSASATLSDAANNQLGDDGLDSASGMLPEDDESSAIIPPVDDSDALADEKPRTADTTSQGSSTKKPVVNLSEAQQSYEEKGAVVFTLDSSHIETYEEGTILKKGSHRFGVFSISKLTPTRLIEKQVEYFTQHEVDFIVVLTTDAAYVEDVEGIDIVVSTQDEELFVMGETKSGTFYVDVPDEGLVGAILISPSNVVSAKVIDAL